jgi:type I restriction enzyme, S subunit
MSFPRYPSYKDSGVKWLGDVPAHWQVLPCRAIVHERTAKNEGAECSDYLSLMANVGIIPYAEKGDVGNKKPDDVSKCKLVSRGDFVINSMNYGIGSYGLSDYDGICSPVYIVLKPQNDIVESRFAFRIFENRAFQTFAQSFGNGILEHRCAINWDILKGIGVGVPPFNEQQAILAFLDREAAKIDDLVREQLQLIELLGEKRQAVISHAVTKGLNPAAPMRASRSRLLGQVPEHWEVVPLKWLTDPERPIMYGIVLPGPDVDEGVPILKGGNVKPSRMNLNSMARTTREIEAPFARARLKSGDLVYSIRGSIGDCEAVPAELEGSNITQDVARVAIGKGVHPAWARWALLASAVRDDLASGSLGAAVRGINIFDLKRAQIPRPPLAEQVGIATHINREVATLDQLSLAAERAIDLLSERRAALISAAVRGQIDVRGFMDSKAA